MSSPADNGAAMFRGAFGSRGRPAVYTLTKGGVVMTRPAPILGSRQSTPGMDAAVPLNTQHQNG